MDQSIVLGITLKADGSGLRGEIAGLSQEIKQQEPLWRSMAAGMGLVNAASALLEGGLNKVREATDFLRNSVQDAARYQTLGVAMEQIGKNAGYTATEMAGFEAGLRANGIAMMESRQTLTQLASAQIELSKSSQLARIAQDAAVIGNINSSEAFGRMIHGIQAGQVEILRTIGITVNFEAAYEKMARRLGINAQLLTENEKAQARANAVVEYGPRIAGAYEAAMGTAGKQLTSMKRYLDDLSVKMGSGFLEAFTQRVFGQADSLKALGAEMDKLLASGDVERWGHSLAEGVASAADTSKDAAKWAWEHRAAIEALAASYITFKISASLGPWIAQRTEAAAAEVRFYSAVASGNAVMIGSAAASRQKAAAEAEATAAQLASAQAHYTAIVALREEQVAALAAANAQYQAAAAMGAHSAAMAAASASAAARVKSISDLAALGRAAATAEAELAAAATAHAAAQGNLSRVMESTSITSRAAGAAQSALSATVAALGGPVGAVITLLGLGATAWMVFGDRGKSAMEKINDEVSRGLDLAKRYQKEARFGSGDRGQINESLAAVQQRIDVLSESRGSKGAAELLSKALREKEALLAARAEVDRRMAQPAAQAGAAQSSGRLSQLASQYAPKPKLAEMLGMLERERDEELKIAGSSAEKRADIERTYQRTRKGIIEQMGADAHRAMMEHFDREAADEKNAQQKRLLGIDTSYRLGMLNEREYADAKLAVENDYFDKSAAILERKFLVSKDASEREKIMADQAALAEQKRMATLQTAADKALAIQQQRAAAGSWAAGQRDGNDQLRFEIELLGKDALAIDQARAAREIDLALRSQLMEAYIDEAGQLQWRSKNLLPEVADGYRQVAEATKQARLQALADKDAASRNWITGVNEAQAEYLRTAADDASMAKRLWSDASMGIEDSFARAASGMEVRSRDLVTALLQDAARLYYRQTYAPAVSNFLGGLSGWVGSYLNGGNVGAGQVVANTQGTYSLPVTQPDMPLLIDGARAGGGGVDAGGLYRVNEEGIEMLTVGGEDYLMMGRRGGYVTPSKSLGGAASPSAAVSPQSLRVELVNNGSQQMRVASAQPSFDAQGMLVKIVLADLRDGGPIRQAITALPRTGG